MSNFDAIRDIINNPTDHNLPAWDNDDNLIEGNTVKGYLSTLLSGMESADDFFNVNNYNSVATYSIKADARSAVPTNVRKVGLVIAYKLSTGWFIEQNLDATAGTWNNDASWQTIGPVSVSQNSAGGYDITVGDSVANVAPQDNYPIIRNETKGDFAISDNNGFNIVVFKDGGIETKKFNSKTTPSLKQLLGYGDFAICDEENNAIVIFKDGHLETKNFNSAKLILNQLGYDFAIADENSYGIVKFLDGHILTKNFDSRLFKNKITQKKVSILGDSISTYQGYMYSPNAYCAYPQTWMDNVKDTYWMRTILRFNAILGVNDSWAGTMVSNTQPTDSGQYGPNRCLSSQTRINHLGENGTPDIIVVYGGTNDIGQQVEIGTFNTENPINYTDAQIAALPVATFADAYRAMLIRLQKTYPNTKIVAIMPNYINSSLDHYISDVLDEYIEMARTICDYFGVKYLDCRTCGITLFNRNTYLGDGIHPNSDGMELISDQLVNLLKTL